MRIFDGLHITLEIIENESPGVTGLDSDESIFIKNEGEDCVHSVVHPIGSECSRDGYLESHGIA